MKDNRRSKDSWSFKCRPLSYQKKKALYGVGFLSLWLFGLIFYFFRPLIETVRMTLGRIVPTDTGYLIEYSGFSNYMYALTEDPDFIREFTASLLSLLYQTPVVIVYVILIAVLLNQKFLGRTVMRAIFFVPVIVAGGVIINILNNDSMSQSIVQGGANSALLQVNNMETYLFELGLPTQMIQPVIDASNNIFNLSWKTGVQILIMLAALQTIPRSLYEASSLEGASGWENFWKITFPMISPMLVLVIVYTVIDSFIDYSNSLMSIIQKKITGGQIELGATMSLLYSLCILVVVGAVYWITSRISSRRSGGE